MQEKYKYMFLRYIYNKMDLNNLEKEIEQNGINSIDEEIKGLYKNISKYFSLLNKVDESRLSEELKFKYNSYFSLPLENLVDERLENEINNFLEQTYKIVLFPNIKENRCFYGPLNYKYMAPRDSVVLGFNYYEFDIGDDNFDEIHNKRESYICNILNHIQFTLADKANMNIAVLKYNEYTPKKKVR